MLNDRRNAMLTDGLRKFLESGGSGYSRSMKSQHRSSIRERVINTFLDFIVLEEHLSEEDREQIFNSLDANLVWDEAADDIELYAEPAEHVTCLSDMLAFVYRETREVENRHPPFEQILENAIIQGENEPGATYYGKYDVTIEAEEVPPEEVHIDAIAHRVEQGEVDQLTEDEMAAFLSVLSQTETFDPDEIGEQFESLREEYREEWGDEAPNLSWILAGGPPFDTE